MKAVRATLAAALLASVPAGAGAQAPLDPLVRLPEGTDGQFCGWHAAGEPVRALYRRGTRSFCAERTDWPASYGAAIIGPDAEHYQAALAAVTERIAALTGSVARTDGRIDLLFETGALSGADYLALIRERHLDVSDVMAARLQATRLSRDPFPHAAETCFFTLLADPDAVLVEMGGENPTPCLDDGAQDLFTLSRPSSRPDEPGGGGGRRQN